MKVEDANTGFNTVIETLAVGETKTFSTSHVVTEADILAGFYTNTVTAKGDPIDDPKDPENPKVPEDEDTVTTGDEDDPDGPTPEIEDKDAHLTVSKRTTSTPADKAGYKPGEIITYELTVTNDGNLTVTDIVLTDELTGNAGSAAIKVGTLEPGQTSKAFTVTYTVTEADAKAGSVHNEATVTGKVDNPVDPDKPVNVEIIPGTRDDPTQTDTKTPVTHDPPIRKVITGDQPSVASTFRFQLKAVSTTVSELNGSMPMPEGSNGQIKIASIEGAGETEFGNITFEKAGTYIYEMSEVNNGVEGYTYDTGVYTVKYVIAEDSTGKKLTCTRTITKNGQAADEVVFTNVYTAPKQKTTEKTGSSANAVKTGDDTPIMMWFLILIAAMAAAAGAWVVSRRRRKAQR